MGEKTDCKRRGTRKMGIVTDDDLLERGGILSSPNPPRAVDGTDGAASVAVATAVRHAAAVGIRVEPAVGNRGMGSVDDRARRFNRGPGRRAIRLVSVSVSREDGEGIGTGVAAEA